MEEKKFIGRNKENAGNKEDKNQCKIFAKKNCPTSFLSPRDMSKNISSDSMMSISKTPCLIPVSEGTCNSSFQIFRPFVYHLQNIHQFDAPTAEKLAIYMIEHHNENQDKLLPFDLE